METKKDLSTRSKRDNISKDATDTFPISLVEDEYSGNNVDQKYIECPGSEAIESKEKTVSVQNVSDGGWGWFIVISSLVIHFICCGLNRASGILFLKFVERFEKTASLTAMVTSLSVSLTFFLGPFSTTLCEKYSYRFVVILGGIALASSMVISAFVSEFYILFASYSVLGGIGKACAYGPGIVMVGKYFNKKRAIAVGIASSGVSLGAFAVPSVVDLSFLEYSYTGAFILMAGMALQLLVCGALLRPYSLHTKINSFVSKDKPRRRSQNYESANEQKTRDQETRIQSDKVNTKNNGKFLYDFSILRNVRFDCLCGAALLFHMAFQSAMIFLPSVSVIIGMENFKSFPVVVTGIFDGIGRVLSGFFFDRKRLLPYRGYIYNIAVLLMGLSLCIVPSASDNIQLGLVCAVYGLLYGTGVSQQSVMIIDLLGTKSLASGFGLLLFFQGLGTFIGPPLSGLLKDVSGSYGNAFYFGGASTLLGGIALLFINIAFHKPNDASNDVVIPT